IRANVRVPEERMADILGQVKATELMDRRLKEYVDRFGLDVVEHAMHAQMDRSELLFRQGVAALPDGVYEFEDFGDRDIMHPDQPRIRVALRMIIEGDQVTFDFTDSDPAPV